MNTIVKVRSKGTVLLPSVQFGNMTLEEESSFEEEVPSSQADSREKELRSKAHNNVMTGLLAQRDEVEKLEKDFFRIKV